jgi:hypothetical protein
MHSKTVYRYLFLVAVLAAVFYLGAERAMISKIRGDIEASLGNDYAIIALHMGGEDFEHPSLWRMLRQAFIYEANFDGEYTPQGSGGFTGKKHHLALLISDHKKISFGEWSFRNWSLVINEYGISEYDIIENLSDADQKLYRHDEGGLRIRVGLIYRNSMFNHEKIRWYYRPVKEPEIS